MKHMIKLSCATLLAGAFLTAPVTVTAATTESGEMKVTQNISETVNLNFATVKQLQALPGIGKKKAEAIIQYREENGSFSSTEELTRVKGIGKKVLLKLSGKVSV
ncbi:MAG: ComEA family DNA-binding protein [Aestuariibacter sp.]